MLQWFPKFSSEIQPILKRRNTCAISSLVRRFSFLSVHENSGLLNSRFWQMVLQSVQSFTNPCNLFSAIRNLNYQKWIISVTSYIRMNPGNIGFDTSNTQFSPIELNVITYQAGADLSRVLGTPLNQGFLIPILPNLLIQRFLCVVRFMENIVCTTSI